MKGGINMKPIIIPVYDNGKTVTMGYEDFCRIIENVYDGGVKDGIEKRSLLAPTQLNNPIFTEPVWRSASDTNKVCGTTPVPTLTEQQSKISGYDQAFPYRVYGRDSEKISSEKSFENSIRNLENGKKPVDL